jgi:hypothetical protein
LSRECFAQFSMVWIDQSIFALSHRVYMAFDL